MNIKTGTTEPEFIRLSCLLSKESAPIDSLTVWSPYGLVFREGPAQTDVLLTSEAKHKSLEQHIEVIQEQSRTFLNEYKNTNLIVTLAATCPNTKLVLSRKELAFFRKNKSSIVIETWESSDLRAEENKSVDLDEDFYSKPSRVWATFRVAGIDLLPDEITQLLRLEPTSSFRPGSLKPGSGDVYDFGKWALSTKNVAGIATEDLDEHFQYLLHSLSGQRSNLRKLRERGLNTVFFIFWEANYYVTRVILSAATLAELDSLKTDIVLDIYF